MMISPKHSASATRAIGFVALALLSSTASALELGAANVRSALGERLLVEVPLANAELAAPSCFGATIDGIREPLGMRKTNDALLISTPRIVTEPLLSLTLTVRCANIARIERDYMLFLDPATRRPADITAMYPIRERTTIAPRPKRQTRITRARPSRTDAQGYTVQVGDTVSELAATIVSDGESIWPVVDQIVADNPAAFLDGDANKLVAGAVLIFRNSPGPGGGARADSRSDRPSPDASPTSVTSKSPDTQPLAQQTMARAEETRPSAASETAQILSVLQGDSAATSSAASVDESEPVSDSPFKTVEQATSDPADTVAPAAAALAAGQGSGTSWLTRVLAMIGGMALAMGAWIIWQIAAGNAARRRRQQEFAAPAAVANQAMARRPATIGAAQPAAYEQTIEISPPERTQDEDYQVAYFDDDDDETFSFHTTLDKDATAEQPAPEPIEVKHTNAPENNEFEVEALESIGMTTIMRGLDEQTQKLLEQDYEAELTHTQQIRRDVAERALKLNAGARVDDERTEEMPVYEETGEMLAAEDLVNATLDMDGVQEAEFVATPADDDATMPMSLDLDIDIDDPSVSMVLRESAGMLEDALRDFEEDETLEQAAPAAKRQA